jgi:hypothetical protein
LVADGNVRGEISEAEAPQDFQSCPNEFQRKGGYEMAKGLMLVA